MPRSLPQFSTLDPETFPSRLNALLTRHLEATESLLDTCPRTWDTLMQPLEQMDNALEIFWSPLSHLQSVTDSEALRACVENCLPKLSAFETAMGQNVRLFEAMRALRETLTHPVDQKILDDALLDFTLSGVTLSETDKKRFEAIEARLAELSHQFQNRVLDATDAFSLQITDEARLKGLPEHALHAARERAQQKGLPGWLLNLEFPCFQAVMTCAEDRALRAEMHLAWQTRASDAGPFAGQYDNSACMQEMLMLRAEKACMLGFGNFAELSLATKMAKTPTEVIDFLTDLCRRARKQAEAEYASLKTFAAAHCGLETLEPWDIGYVSEQQRHACFDITQESLRPWFSEPQVLQGLFDIIKRLYGVTFEPVEGVDVWHPDVKCLALLDAERAIRGYLYVDLFARARKRGGAWMDACQSRWRMPDGSLQLPVATLTCNFAKPAAGRVPALSHEEVITLFHEMGHCLHHLLTRVERLGASGIRGVEWDAVELPSQFHENWCWDFEALSGLSAHVETGEPLPRALFDKMLAARNFQSALSMLRQVEFALFDFQLHLADAASPKVIDHTLEAVREQTAVLPLAPYQRFAHSFSHIFGGGYAAGYYSYLWAEVLSSDAFARFEEEGIFNADTGRDFLRCVLEVGGSRPAAVSFQSFRGRAPAIDALLRHNEIGGRLPAYCDPGV